MSGAGIPYPRILRAWVTLIALSGAASLVSVMAGAGMRRDVLGSVVLILAALKARVILARYLGLDRAPGWLSGFVTVIGLFCALALALYLVPVFRS